MTRDELLSQLENDLKNDKPIGIGKVYIESLPAFHILLIKNGIQEECNIGMNYHAINLDLAICSSASSVNEAMEAIRKMTIECVNSNVAAFGYDNLLAQIESNQSGDDWVTYRKIAFNIARQQLPTTTNKYRHISYSLKEAA